MQIVNLKSFLLKVFLIFALLGGLFTGGSAVYDEYYSGKEFTKEGHIADDALLRSPYFPLNPFPRDSDSVTHLTPEEAGKSTKSGFLRNCEQLDEKDNIIQYTGMSNGQLRRCKEDREKMKSVKEKSMKTLESNRRGAVHASKIKEQQVEFEKQRKDKKFKELKKTVDKKPEARQRLHAKTMMYTARLALMEKMTANHKDSVRILKDYIAWIRERTGLRQDDKYHFPRAEQILKLRFAKEGQFSESQQAMWEELQGRVMANIERLEGVYSDDLSENKIELMTLLEDYHVSPKSEKYKIKRNEEIIWGKEKK